MHVSIKRHPPYGTIWVAPQQGSFKTQGAAHCNNGRQWPDGTMVRDVVQYVYQRSTRPHTERPPTPTPAPAPDTFQWQTLCETM
jgi:hypothetical protein